MTAFTLPMIYPALAAGVALLVLVVLWYRRRLSRRPASASKLGTASLRQMRTSEFVRLVGQAFEARGYNVVESGVKGARAEGAVDIELRKDREAHERMIDARLRQSDVQIVALAGYMLVLTPYLVETWAGRMINIHPSLLPAFPGLHTHQRALEAGVAKHGCTVHLVTTGVDEGPILGQAEVDVLPGDDEEKLGARVLEQEHQLYARCLAELVRGLNGPDEIR